MTDLFEAAGVEGPAATTVTERAKRAPNAKPTPAPGSAGDLTPSVEELAATPVDVDSPSPAELRELVRRDPPPYALPTLAEMLSAKPNGYTAVSTFSGCGGSCLGFRWAGWYVPFAVEFVEAARDTYKANMPTTFLYPQDIRDLGVTELLEALELQPGELDCLEGSPPCANFSTIGAREKYWGKEKAYSDTKQRSDDLFMEYARLLDGLKPKTFVAENVPGLGVGAADEAYYRPLLALFHELGYFADAKVLCASNYGVPQSRRRLIFVGVRRDLGVSPRHPRPADHDHHTLRQALRWAGEPTPDERRVRRFDRFAIGAEWRRMRANTDSGRQLIASGDHAFPGEGDQSDKYFMLELAELGRPCPTITVAGQVQLSISAPCHPREPRKFCLDELRAICGFPRDFVLTGTYDQQVERMARAVPPSFMRAVAAEVASILDEAKR